MFRSKPPLFEGNMIVSELWPSVTWTKDELRSRVENKTCMHSWNIIVSACGSIFLSFFLRLEIPVHENYFRPGREDGPFVQHAERSHRICVRMFATNVQPRNFDVQANLGLNALGPPRMLFGSRFCRGSECETFVKEPNANHNNFKETCSTNKTNNANARLVLSPFKIHYVFLSISPC